MNMLTFKCIFGITVIQCVLAEATEYTFWKITADYLDLDKSNVILNIG
jgi:hypothetical protein